MKEKFLPQQVKTKLYKTGQTRGADDDVIYQNRVGRNSTVLIPYNEFEICGKAPTNNGIYENGFIVLVKPEFYFSVEFRLYQKKYRLKLGENLLVFYETREQWKNFPPTKGWKEAISRTAPLGGQYVARVPATTSESEKKIIKGFFSSKMKGAGIRVYEYADTKTINQCRLQLELLFWKCTDIEAFIEESGYDKGKVKEYIAEIERKANSEGLYDEQRLRKARIIDKDGYTICPLCLKHISARGFCSRMIQAEGREVPDLTVTETSLFHIHELRTGEFNHKPYNLGWGHHHCNVVVKDAGIQPTLQWMRDVIRRNDELEKCDF